MCWHQDRYDGVKTEPPIRPVFFGFILNDSSR
jgi:hypothetical protein